VIDPGHGGQDEGAKGPGGALEKDVVLDVGRRLAEALEEEGLRVVMTRRADEFVSLEKRTYIANDARGDLFVSIHANAANDTSIRGTETFFLSLEATDEAARRVAERENQAFGAAVPLPRAADDPLVAILGDLIEVGIDVFHPVQKGTMDEVAVAREFGDRLTFLAGIDVQHTLQEKDPQGVREEVRFLIDTFDGPNGGMCIAAGNGILAGTPFENIEAFLDEALRYGITHRSRFVG